MAIKAGVGLSKNTSSSQAGYEAAKFALKQCGVEKPDFVVVFASSTFNQKELMSGVTEATKNAPMIGCTSAGEITSNGVFTKSVVVMAIKSDSLRFYTGLGKNVKAGAREAGKSVASEIKEKAAKTGDELKAFIMFPDVLTGNGADAVRGVLDVLGAHFLVVGGAPGDDFIFKETFEYRDGEVVSGAVG